MNNSSNFILSLILKGVFIVAMLVAVGMLSKLYSYFKTGAVKTDIINKTIISKNIHEPEIYWNLTNYNGAILDVYTQKEIQEAYSAAWYIMNKSVLNKSIDGLEDHLAENLFERVKNKLDSTSQSVESRVDLNHNIDLHLFSLDRQLISFTDNHVNLVRKINTVSSNPSVYIKDTLSYDVVMGLEDGYWKLVEFIQTKASLSENTIVDEITGLPSYDFSIKAINYYPAEYPWFEFWTEFEPEIIEKDFSLLQGMGFNSVRIFLPYQVFGGSDPAEEVLLKLEKVLSLLDINNLKAIVCLFDFPASYHLDHYPASIQHAKKIMSRFKENKTIYAWDLKNEPNLDFDSYSQEVVINWLKEIIQVGRKYAPSHKLTIGWSRPEAAPILSSELDLVSFHCYRSIKNETEVIQRIKSQIGNKDMFLSEFGRTSWRSIFWPFGYTANQQALYAQQSMDMIAKLNIKHFAYWTLHDFIEVPNSVFGWKPWIKSSQKNMGLLTTDGNIKPVANVFKSKDQIVVKNKLSDHIKPFYFLILLFFGVTGILFKYRKRIWRTRN